MCDEGEAGRPADERAWPARERASRAGEPRPARLTEAERQREARLAEAERQRAAAVAQDHAVADLPFLLRQASRSVDALLRDTLTASDLGQLSLTGLQILGLARTAHPIVTLAEKLKVSPQAAGRAVSVLEAAGLVEKGPGYPDSRVVLVETTGEGRHVLCLAHDAVADALGLVADDVAEGRLPQIADDLARIAWVDRAQRRPRRRW